MRLLDFYNSLRSLALVLILFSSLDVYADIPYPGTTSIFISYANTQENSNLNKSPTIKLSFDGNERQIPLIMDTGSVGIVVSADLFDPAPDSKNLGSGKQYYSSSGIIEEGTWWSATQKIYDGNGNLLATSNVPVLRVTSIKCGKDSRSCKRITILQA